LVAGGRRWTPRSLSRESERHELDVARCGRFCFVAHAATGSPLLLRLAADPEQKWRSQLIAPLS
jgi:hypothetical protein